MNHDEREELHVKWITEELLPSLAKDGHFTNGEKCTIREYQIDDSLKKGVECCSSNNYFVSLQLESTNGEVIHKEVIVKSESPDEEFRRNIESDKIYYNECRTYNKSFTILKSFLKGTELSTLLSDLTPHCYYARYSESAGQSVVVLENLKTTGYRPATSKVELDLEHCRMAMTKIGQFHGISLALKQKNTELFNDVVTGFKENIFFEQYREENQVFYGLPAKKMMDSVVERNKEGKIKSEYLQKLREILENPHELLVEVLKPKEPFSILCHGDFNRNNILFRYDETGVPVDLKLIDFQEVHHSQPAIDLSLFIFLNTTPEFRHLHLKHLLQIHYTSLVRTVSAILAEGESIIKGLCPRQLMAQEFADHSVFGCVQAAYYLPIIMASTENLNLEECTTILGCEEESLDVGSRMEVRIGDRIAGIIFDFDKFGFFKDPGLLQL